MMNKLASVYNDSLFRVSFKCLIIDESGKVLVVKEQGRSSWDVPGGGIEYGETIEEAIGRELREEVSFIGTFGYRVLKIHDPVTLLTRDVWQIKIVILLTVDNFNFSVGEDADEIRFADPNEFLGSEHQSESRIPEYFELAHNPGA